MALLLLRIQDRLLRLVMRGLVYDLRTRTELTRQRGGNPTRVPQTADASEACVQAGFVCSWAALDACARSYFRTRPSGGSPTSGIAALSVDWASQIAPLTLVAKYRGFSPVVGSA